MNKSKRERWTKDKNDGNDKATKQKKNNNRGKHWHLYKYQDQSRMKEKNTHFFDWLCLGLCFGFAGKFADVHQEVGSQI